MDVIRSKTGRHRAHHLRRNFQNRVPRCAARAHRFRPNSQDWHNEGLWAERALAHIIKNQAKTAHHRTHLLDPLSSTTNHSSYSLLLSVI